MDLAADGFGNGVSLGAETERGYCCVDQSMEALPWESGTDSGTDSVCIDKDTGMQYSLAIELEMAALVAGLLKCLGTVQ